MYVLVVQTGNEARVINSDIYITPLTHPPTGQPLQTLIIYNKSSIKAGVQFLLKKYPDSVILITQVLGNGSQVEAPKIQFHKITPDGDLIPTKDIDF